MDKRKALMVGVVAILVILVAIFGFHEAVNPTGNPEEGYLEGYLRISQKTHCSTDAEDAIYSKNPPYFVGEKYYWWIKTTVTADANVSDVVVYDELGGELVIVGISFRPIEKPRPYTYTFYYSFYAAGGGVSVTDGATVWWGYLDETGVTFDGFFVYWSEETLEAHIEWTVGSMKEGDVKDLYVTVSTDTNPSGIQEFTSAGTYFLNAGAVVEGIVESTGKKTVTESDRLEIEVLEKIE